MKLFTALRQPAVIGVALFIAAATILLAVIMCGYVGLSMLALTLSHLAQPVCAAAVGVLMYLALTEQRAEASPH